MMKALVLFALLPVFATSQSNFQEKSLDLIKKNQEEILNLRKNQKAPSIGELYQRWKKNVCVDLVDLRRIIKRSVEYTRKKYHEKMRLQIFEAKANIITYQIFNSSLKGRMKFSIDKVKRKMKKVTLESTSGEFFNFNMLKKRFEEVYLRNKLEVCK